MGVDQLHDLGETARLFAERSRGRFSQAVEPVLQRATLPLVFLFLFIATLVLSIKAIGDRDQALSDTQHRLQLLAFAVSAQLPPDRLKTREAQSALNTLLSQSVLPAGGAIFLLDEGGTIIAHHINETDLTRSPKGTTLLPFLANGQEQVGENAATSTEGFIHVEMDRKTGERLIIRQRHDTALAGWYENLLFNSIIFLAAGIALLLMGWIFRRQVDRGSRADAICDTVQSRLDMALQGSRCGLWDWDISRGHLFWSRSMFELLGMEPRETSISSAEMQALIHPEDCNLYQLTGTMLQERECVFDQTFRMRHKDGFWVWLRARGEMLEAPPLDGPHLVGIAVDLTEQNALAQQSKTANIRLHDAIESISETFILWDSSDKLITCNSKYKRIHDLPDEALKPGRRRDEVAQAARRPVVRKHSSLASRKNKEGAHTFETQLSNGQWLQINERRTKDGGCVSIGTDITSLKQHEARLMESRQELQETVANLRRSRLALERQAQQLVNLAGKYALEKERAEAASKTKSRFLANITHELHTPLNAIIGFSEIMESELFGRLGSQKYAEYCRAIRESGQHLMGIISDILEISGIEDNRVELHMEDVNPIEIIKESVECMTPCTTIKKLLVKIKSDIACSIKADRKALRRILLRLLSNAVKFTPEGGAIQLHAFRQGDRLVISVRDTGIGIPESALHKLGHPFEQAGDLFSRTHGGSGLGLAIARSLAELHGGDMRIESKDRKGTCVSISLPIHTKVEKRVSEYSAA